MGRKINIAVIIETELWNGGNFQVELSSALRFKNSKDLSDFNFFFFSTNKNNISILSNYKIDTTYISINYFDNLISLLRRKIFNVKIRKIFNFFFGTSKLEDVLLKKNIDIVHFNSVSKSALNLENISYGVTYWDSNHLEHPEFPESHINNRFEDREMSYNFILKKSTYIISDCDESILNLIKRYNVIREKIYKIYSLPSVEVRNFNDSNFNENWDLIKKKYNLLSPYIFYPAQLWPHKNHFFILKGLQLLRDKYNITIKAVFTGRDAYENINYLKKISKNFGLEKQIIFTGLVENKEIPYLYKSSIALVMPTYCGPTNLPPVEAFFLETPVIYSEHFFNCDQLGDSFLPIKLDDPNTLALAVLKLMKESDLKRDLIKKGNIIKDRLLKNDRESINIFKNIFNNFSLKRDCWEK
jgi:glycosyltransferase involved in cell wall biosynthesis